MVNVFISLISTAASLRSLHEGMPTSQTGNTTTETI